MPRLNPRPPRTENRFRERELARAVRAAKAAGGERVEIDPTSGRITVVIGQGDAEMQAAGAKAWEDATEQIVKSKRKVPKSAPTRR